MHPLTREWVDKAEGDFLTAGREVRTRKSPNYDAVCFHAQQMAEKYLKAFLQENGLTIPRTHVLADLLGLCLQIDGGFQLIRDELNTLEGYAVQFRYPGTTAEKEEAKSAYHTAVLIREFIRSHLGI
jgi:HEPN domain-containing protein